MNEMKRAAILLTLLLALLLVVGSALAATLYDARYDTDGDGVISTNDRATAVAYYDANMGAYDPARVTPTALPTTEPSPVVTATPDGVPLCTEHDPHQWHALLSADGSCHYNHEHGDNPHELDDVFGTQIYEWAGGGISYPWQTGATHTEENAHKHETYRYITLRDLAPSLSEGRDGYTNRDLYFVRDIRIQAHSDLNVLGAPTRFHSSYVEVRMCDRANPDTCGIARWGGHQDYGELKIDGAYYPLPTDDPNYDPHNDNQIFHRHHSASDNFVNWVGRFFSNRDLPDFQPAPINYAGFQHQTEDAFGPLDPNDLDRVILTDPEIYNNSTARLTHLVIRNRDGFDVDGRINWFGYTTDKGLSHNTSCTAPGPDCVPMSLENWPFLNTGGYDPAPSETVLKEYDTSPVGEQWIEYPN